MQRKETAGGYIRTTLFVAVLVIAAAAILAFIHHKRTTGAAKAQVADLSSYCVGRMFNIGSSGHCVSDIQTIVNYMEHSGLTQCPFADGAELTVDGTYDAETSAQVKSVQQWASCYAKQEGFSSNVPQTGAVEKTTWDELCTYGYTDPLHSSATKAGTTIAAGKDAGCSQLQT